MAKDIMSSTAKLPAHLAALGGIPALGDWGSGTTGGFPVISTKGKFFHIRRGDDNELVLGADGDPAQSLQVIILKTHPGSAKTYYAEKYVEGSDEKPTCYSADGIAPASDALDRQAKKCAVCPHNQWGSRVTESGAQAKACSDVKRLAVAAAGQINDPMLLRVPPTSLKVWDTYVGMLAKRGLTPAHVITKVSFDPTVSHQFFVLKVVDFITAEMVPQIEEALRDPVLDKIIGSDVGHAPEDAPAPAPALPKPEKKEPTKKQLAAKAAAEAAAVAAAALAAAEEEEEEEEEIPVPPPASKKKKAASKPAPVVDDEEEEETTAEGDDAFGDLDFDDLDFGDDD